MEQNMTRQTEAIIRKHKRWKRWQKVVSMMACVVVFCTTYALILPAITMTGTAQVLSCPVAIHNHTAACYDSEHKLVCGEADYVVHVHDESCYDEEGSCVCALPEIREHQHDSSCYRELSQLICTEEVKPGHVHGDECYTLSQPELICTEESEEHTHTEDCYVMEKVLVCGMEEGEGSHNHTAECYRTSSLLDCEKKGVLHTHTDKCYDNSHELICGEIEVLEHVHADGCFETVEIEEPGEETQPSEETEPAQEQRPDEETTPQETEPNEEKVGGSIEMDESVGAFEDTIISEEIVIPMATTPIDVSPYIKSVSDDGNARTQLKYKEGNGDWVVVDSNTTIPGDATLRLDVAYGNVDIDDLIAHGGQLSYNVPGFMRNPTAQGAIMNGNTQVGTIVVENGKALITFDQSFLQAQKANNQTKLNGTFYIESQVNLSYVETQKPPQLVAGPVTIDLAWEDQIVAKNAEIRIDKTIVNTTIEVTPQGSFLTYTIKVSNRADAVQDVKIIDKYTDTTYVDSYVGVSGTRTRITSVSNVTESGAPNGNGGYVYLGNVSVGADGVTTVSAAGNNAQKPGTMIWEIGSMAPYEERTLTYKVKLKDGYVGYSAKAPLVNDATAYSKGYKHDHDPVTFTPKATGTGSKRASTPIKNADGSYTIEYVLTITADKDNSYALKNAGWNDTFQWGPKSNYSFLHYDADSFKLYDVVNGEEVLNTTANPNLTIEEDIARGKNNFAYTFGELQPGESKTLHYTVNVDKDIFASNGNGNVDIGNSMKPGLVEQDNTTFKQFLSTGVSVKLGSKKWDRKMAGGKINSSQTISMSGDVYDATGSTVSKISSPPSSFTVPEGSYKYTVIANEAGDWNLSSASLKDKMNNPYMPFVGYVRVDAFAINNDAPATSLTDDQAIAYFEGKTPANTVWVKVDGKSQFGFSPNEIGLNGQYAYRLTYYAKPNPPPGWDGSPVVISNEFGIGGIIGQGGIIIPDIIAKADVVVSEIESSAIQKLAWYYDAKKDNQFTNGKLMWAIKLSGESVSRGFTFVDSTWVDDLGNGSPGFKSYMVENSVMGVYKSSADITQYASLQDALAAGVLTEVTDCLTLNTDLVNQYQNLVFQAGLVFTKDIPLSAGEDLYVVLATNPYVLPTKTEAGVYENSIYALNDAGTDWEKVNTAELPLSGNEGIAKTPQFLFSVSDDAIVSDNGKPQYLPGSDGKVNPNHPLIILHGNNGGAAENGTYISWMVTVNSTESMNGQNVIMEELIPEGLEFAGICFHYAYDGKDRQYFTDLTELTGEGWQRRVYGTNTYTYTYDTHAYDWATFQMPYYVKNNVVRVGLNSMRGKVTFEIYCRVTDPDVLLGEEEKTFMNTVNVLGSDGSLIDDDSSPITVKKYTMAKNTVVEEEYLDQVLPQYGYKFPFMIIANGYAEDLVKGSDTVTVIDTMSNSLKIDVSTISVYDVTNSRELTSDEYSVQIEGQTMKFTVPDGICVRIFYLATIQAAPDEPVTITNDAHWEGYEPGEYSQVEIRDFSYTAGGTVGTSDTPYIVITKLDQYDISKKLPNAKFKITEVELKNGQFTAKSGGQVWNSNDMVTGADGTLTVGRESGKLMKWNTVYMVEEIAAPDGYVLDAQPHYFAVAKMEYGAYPAALTNYKNTGATIHYLGAEYSYAAYNHKYQASLVKTFRDSGDTSVEKIDGTYRFGIFEVTTQNGKETVASTPLEIKELVIGKGVVSNRITFQNLDGTKSYRIYEVDDQGRRIENNSAALAGSKMFDVTYTGGADGTNKVTFGNGAASDITITNSVRYTELPQTGGMGTTAIYALGASLMMLSAAAFVLKRKIAY